MNLATKPFPEMKVCFERMKIRHVREVLSIETAVFPFPWEHASFVSCVANDYECWVMNDQSDAVVGYFIVMKVVDEAHLLTFAIRGDAQGQGLGRILLEKVIAVARGIGMDSVFLEVRDTNQRARDLYSHLNFIEIGRRKNYYPAGGNTREDAIMMRLPL
jgi:ribosomal-protein-alanine N-acetyltransferase